MADYTVKTLSGDASTEGSLSYAIAQVNAGNYTGIKFDSSLKDAVIDFSAFNAINGTISISNGTLDNFTGKINVVSDGAGYGISGSYGSREITNSTGSISVTAAKTAVGIDAYYNVTTSSVITNKLTFDKMASNLTVGSTFEDAYGIRLYTKAYYYSGATGISELYLGAMSGHITVTAKNASHGIYVYAGDNNGKGTNKALISADTFTGEMSVTGGTVAYGFYASAYAFDKAEISIGKLNGNIAVTGGTGDAYGFQATNALNIVSEKRRFSF